MAWGLLVPGLACELHRFRAGLFVGRGHPPKRPLETVPGHGNGCRRGPGQPSIASVLPSYAENVQSTSPDASAQVRPAASRPVFVPAAKVGLSTSSVYPESTSSAFELARRLGYDGVELMVGLDPVAADIDAVEKLRDYHGVPVLSIHSPCLLITQRVWGTDPWAKLERSAEAAQRLGADIVVVHPPFRWHRDYADLTLDVSHASTSNQQSLALARAWGDRLRHVHLTDGTGSVKDEHLVPGRGDQHAGMLLNYLAEQRFEGHIVVEINSRRSETRASREADLAESLAFTRLHLAAPAHTAYAVDAGGVASVL